MTPCARAGLTGLAAAGVLGHGLAVFEPFWIGLRVAVGFCFAGVYMTIESWLNDRASDENRGRVLAIYQKRVASNRFHNLRP